MDSCVFPRLSRLKKLLQTLACTARGLTNPDVTRATPNEENRALMIIQPSANVHSVTDVIAVVVLCTLLCISSKIQQEKVAYELSKLSWG